MSRTGKKKLFFIPGSRGRVRVVGTEPPNSGKGTSGPIFAEVRLYVELDDGIGYGGLAIQIHREDTDLD